MNSTLLKHTLFLFGLFFFSLFFSMALKAEELHTLFVFSDPPLSNIYVNGKKQEAQTPAVIRVPASTTPVLEVKADGYHTHKQVVQTKGSGSKLTVELTPY